MCTIQYHMAEIPDISAIESAYIRDMQSAKSSIKKSHLALKAAYSLFNEYRFTLRTDYIDSTIRFLDYIESFHISASKKGSSLLIESRILRGLCYGYLSRSQEAWELLQQYGHLHQTADDYLKGFYLFVCGFIKKIQGEIHTALSYAKDACDCFAQLQHNDFMERSYYMYSTLLREIGDYTTAFTFASTSLEIGLRVNSRSIGTYLLGIGILHHLMSDGPKGLEYLHSALEYFSKNGNEHGKAMVYQALGTYYSTIEDDDSALEWYLKAYDVSTTIGANLNRIMLCIGDAYNHLGQYENALQTLHKGIRQAEIRGNATDVMYIKRRISSVMIAQKEYDAAEELLHHCLEYFTNTLHSPPELYAVNLMLAEIAEHRCQFDKALEFYKSYHHWRAKVYEHEQMTSIKQIQFRLQREVAARERDQLRLQTIQLEQDVEKQRGELAAMALSIAQKNSVIDRLNNRLSELAARNDLSYSARCNSIMHEIELLKTTGEHQWEHLQKQFESIDPEYEHRLHGTYPLLSTVETKICLLMRLNLSTKDIASILWISPRTVETHRYSIRRKMKLKKDDNLHHAISNVR